MMKKSKHLILGIFLVLALSLISFISAETSYCCEKTVDGAYCQNAPEMECNSQFKKAPTSCESTSYCKEGTCIDSQEGLCSEKTPQIVCENDGGVWSEEPIENLGQCQLGCCAIGDQTAYVTQTRCKRLSSLYGLETDYRTDITSEIQCIASSNPDVKGACAFTREYERTCLMLTKAECQEFEASAEGEYVEFFEGKLCSDENLGTNCGPSKKTTCVEGDDAIYFLDTCGNIANVYDSSKENDKVYWSDIVEKEDSCGYLSEDGHANSASCGNCDYYLGSTCKDYSVLSDSERPNLGNYICADLGCEYDTNRDGEISNDEEYKHGETWCGTNNVDFGDYNVPGTSHYRYVCYNGEVTVEPCADYRQETCLESSIDFAGGEYSVGSCVVNRWQDCFVQVDEETCTDTGIRDCKWVDEDDIIAKTFLTEVYGEDAKGYCLPEVVPGYDFWEGESSAKDVCATSSTVCTVVLEEGLFGGHGFMGLRAGRDIKEGRECITMDGERTWVNEEWLEEQTQMCMDLGDCGNNVNYIGKQGDDYNMSMLTGNFEEVKTE